MAVHILPGSHNHKIYSYVNGEIVVGDLSTKTINDYMAVNDNALTKAFNLIFESENHSQKIYSIDKNDYRKIEYYPCLYGYYEITFNNYYDVDESVWFPCSYEEFPNEFKNLILILDL